MSAKESSDVDARHYSGSALLPCIVVMRYCISTELWTKGDNISSVYLFDKFFLTHLFTLLSLILLDDEY